MKIELIKFSNKREAFASIVYSHVRSLLNSEPSNISIAGSSSFCDALQRQVRIVSSFWTYRADNANGQLIFSF